MNSYFNLQKINFVHNNNNNYTCYILYEFTGYRKLITFNIEINDGQIKHVYIDAFNNSFQITDNPLSIVLDPHIFYLKLQRINNYIKILEVQNADYITDSVVNYGNLTLALLDNFYMLSSILIEDVQNLETLDISIKERLRAIYNQINDIYSSINNINQINNQQNNQINDIYSRLNNIDQINNQQSNEINIHENNIYSLLDNFYMLSGLLLENTQNLETLDISIKEKLREIYNQINDIYSRLNNADQINNRQDINISKLNIFVEEINSLYYSDYAVTNNLNSVPASQDKLVYVTSNNKLYKYTTIGWVEIDWQKIIMTMPEYRIDRLRIIDNVLHISPNGANWYPCYPLVGSKTFRIHTIDNTNYSYKYYLPPGATVTIENANHVPIVYTPAIVPMFFFQGFWTHPYQHWVGLRPSNIAISNGDGQWLGGNNISAGASRITNSSIVPFYEQANVNENWNHATLTIRDNQRWLVLGQNQGNAGYEILVTCCSGTASSTSYWLGTWYRQDGVQFTAEYVTITRRR